MDIYSFVSTGFVASSRWEGPEVWGVGPVVGIGGCLRRSRAPAMFSCDVTFCCHFLRKNCAKYEIQEDDVVVTTVHFEI